MFWLFTQIRHMSDFSPETNWHLIRVEISQPLRTQICSQRNFDWASGSLIIWQIGLFVKHALLLSEFGQLLNSISQVGVAIVAMNWFSYILQRKQSCEYGNGCYTCGGDSKPQNLICPWSYLHESQTKQANKMRFFFSLKYLL